MQIVVLRLEATLVAGYSDNPKLDDPTAPRLNNFIIIYLNDKYLYIR